MYVDEYMSMYMEIVLLLMRNTQCIYRGPTHLICIVLQHLGHHLLVVPVAGFLQHHIKEYVTQEELYHHM